MLQQDSLIYKQAVRGVAFTTLDVDTPVYLNYLVNRLQETGVSIIRGSVQHISQLVEGGLYPFTREGTGPRAPDAVVVCTGLGARTLGGVEDMDVYPIRGQTVLLRAPWVRFGRGMSSGKGAGFWTYIIPRTSGDVSLSIWKHGRLDPDILFSFVRLSLVAPRISMIG